MRKNLNKNSIIRYSRQIILKNIGTFGQKKILNSKVLIVDDICDSGETFERLSNYIKENINHECEVRFSALWWNNECDFKPHYFIKEIAKYSNEVWIDFPHESWWKENS